MEVQQVADGVHRLGDGIVNCYALVEERRDHARRRALPRQLPPPARLRPAAHRPQPVRRHRRPHHARSPRPHRRGGPAAPRTRRPHPRPPGRVRPREGPTGERPSRGTHPRGSAEPVATVHVALPGPQPPTRLPPSGLDPRGHPGGRRRDAPRAGAAPGRVHPRAHPGPPRLPPARARRHADRRRAHDRERADRRHRPAARGADGGPGCRVPLARPLRRARRRRPPARPRGALGGTSAEAVRVARETASR
jgi:hypothetical protein